MGSPLHIAQCGVGLPLSGLEGIWLTWSSCCVLPTIYKKYCDPYRSFFMSSGCFFLLSIASVRGAQFEP